MPLYLVRRCEQIGPLKFNLEALLSWGKRAAHRPGGKLDRGRPSDLATALCGVRISKRTWTYGVRTNTDLRSKASLEFRLWDETYGRREEQLTADEDSLDSVGGAGCSRYGKERHKPRRCRACRCRTPANWSVRCWELKMRGRVPKAAVCI
jgi:hypothetical protein